MKKSILILAFGLSIVSINSCSRGYGCPYGSIENENLKPLEPTTQLVIEEAKTEDAECLTK